MSSERTARSCACVTCKIFASPLCYDSQQLAVNDSTGRGGAVSDKRVTSGVRYRVLKRIYLTGHNNDGLSAHTASRKTSQTYTPHLVVRRLLPLAGSQLPPRPPDAVEQVVHVHREPNRAALMRDPLFFFFSRHGRCWFGS